MKARYGEPSIRISITITDREHIFRWGRTRPSHERFSRRKWGPSRLYRRLVDCTTATNGGLPERARIYTRLRGPYPAALKSISRTVPPCTGVHRRIWFTRLEQGRKLLELCGSFGGMRSAMGRTEFSVDGEARIIVSRCAAALFQVSAREHCTEGGYNKPHSGACLWGGLGSITLVLVISAFERSGLTGGELASRPRLR